MNGSYLLDTNIVAALFRKDSAVNRHLEAAPNILVPSIAVGELYYGARKSSRVSENLNQVDDFCSQNELLDCDLETARVYGEIKNLLRQKGYTLPENDVWIAAIALGNGLTLVTRDAHFREIDGLEIETW